MALTSKLALAAWLMLAAPAAQAQEAFTSDTWIPVDEEASAALATGDAQLVLALQGGRGAQLAWDKAFEAWSTALRTSASGAIVPTAPRNDLGALEPHLMQLFPDRDGTFMRRHEAVEYAVLRRLSALPPEGLAAWIERSAPRASAAFALSSSELVQRRSDLARIEREFPGTRAAARAALESFDLAFEQGRPLVAESWLARAQRHARLAGAHELLAALEPRRAALPSSAVPELEPAWATAEAFEPTSQHTLVLPESSKSKSFARIDGPAGLATLGDERLVVQISDRVWILAGHDEDRSFEPWEVADELGSPVPRTAGRPGRDWPLIPAAAGSQLYIIADRADGVTSNLVQRLHPPHDLDLPMLVWSLGGDGLYAAEGLQAPLDELLGKGLWEFQPGPILAGDLLLVQARQWTQNEQDGVSHVNSPGEAKAWLLALEVRTGKPRWRRLLCRGTDVLADLGARFGRQELIRTPGTPPVLLGHRVFIGTNLGAGALLDLADGRLAWSFLVERRDPDVPGWQGSEAPIVDKRAPKTPAMLWAPRDAAELYALRGVLDFDPGAEPILAHTPLAIGESERLVGGDLGLALTYGWAGAKRTLSAHELHSGKRYDSIFLGREERFLGRALVSADKILCLTDRGLYRFDRKRELYLELVHSLSLDAAWTAGGLWARGEEVFVLASGGMFTFRVR